MTLGERSGLLIGQACRILPHLHDQDRVDTMGEAGDVSEVDGSHAELRFDLQRMKEEHRDLDSAINALELGSSGDQLQIQRLKKRKLVLRDRITHIEDQLHPDIIA